MKNPFFFREIPVDAPFCDRQEELRQLQSWAEGKANVVLYSPRRYGKTSLVKRVQSNLAQKGVIVIFADFFGVASTEDVASRLASAVFSVTYKHKPLWEKAIRYLKVFRPVLKPDAEGFSLSVEPTGGNRGIALLNETMSSIGELIKNSKQLLNITLDEFQEIVELPDSLQIEAALRTHIQSQQASYFFVGSRRTVLLKFFTEKHRPFYQSAITYELKRLPLDELVSFISRLFEKGGIKCTPQNALNIAEAVGCHPYYSQKLCFFTFDLAKGSVSDKIIQDAMVRLLESERPVFETILQDLSPRQKLLLRALADDPTDKIFAAEYLKKHDLKSVGGIQSSLSRLLALDIIEHEGSGPWRLVDPLLPVFIKNQSRTFVS